MANKYRSRFTCPVRPKCRRCAQGHTSFTLLLPTVNLLSGQHTITTLGITTMHRTTIAGIGRGQLTSYSATTLHGTATAVDF